MNTKTITTGFVALLMIIMALAPTTMNVNNLNETDSAEWAHGNQSRPETVSWGLFDDDYNDNYEMDSGEGSNGEIGIWDMQDGMTYFINITAYKTIGGVDVYQSGSDTSPVTADYDGDSWMDSMGIGAGISDGCYFNELTLYDNDTLELIHHTTVDYSIGEVNCGWNSVYEYLDTWPKDDVYEIAAADEMFVQYEAGNLVGNVTYGIYWEVWEHGGNMSNDTLAGSGDFNWTADSSTLKKLSGFSTGPGYNTGCYYIMVSLVDNEDMYSFETEFWDFQVFSGTPMDCGGSSGGGHDRVEFMVVTADYATDDDFWIEWMVEEGLNDSIDYEIHITVWNSEGGVAATHIYDTPYVNEYGYTDGNYKFSGLADGCYYLEGAIGLTDGLSIGSDGFEFSIGDIDCSGEPSGGPEVVVWTEDENYLIGDEILLVIEAAYLDSTLSYKLQWTVYTLDGNNSTPILTPGPATLNSVDYYQETHELSPPSAWDVSDEGCYMAEAILFDNEYNQLSDDWTVFIIDDPSTETPDCGEDGGGDQYFNIFPEDHIYDYNSGDMMEIWVEASGYDSNSMYYVNISFYELIIPGSMVGTNLSGWSNTTYYTDSDGYFLESDGSTGFNDGYYYVSAILIDSAGVWLNYGEFEFSFGDDEGGGDECPFDDSSPDSPCYASECEDHESSACYEYVMGYCEDAGMDDPGCDDMGDDDGEDFCDLAYVEFHLVTSEMGGVQFVFDMICEMSMEQSMEFRDMIDMYAGDGDGTITATEVAAFMEMMNACYDDDGNEVECNDECPFDPYSDDSPCSAVDETGAVCDWDDPSEGCLYQAAIYCSQNWDELTMEGDYGCDGDGDEGEQWSINGFVMEMYESDEPDWDLDSILDTSGPIITTNYMTSQHVDLADGENTVTVKFENDDESDDDGDECFEVQVLPSGDWSPTSVSVTPASDWDVTNNADSNGFDFYGCSTPDTFEAVFEFTGDGHPNGVENLPPVCEFKWFMATDTSFEDGHLVTEGPDGDVEIELAAGSYMISVWCMDAEMDPITVTWSAPALNLTNTYDGDGEVNGWVMFVVPPGLSEEIVVPYSWTSEEWSGSGEFIITLDSGEGDGDDIEGSGGGLPGFTSLMTITALLGAVFFLGRRD